jgi:hypothetical protein
MVASVRIFWYVDDTMIPGNHDQVEYLQNVSHSQFDLHDLGEAGSFLGFQTVWDRTNMELWVG